MLLIHARTVTFLASLFTSIQCILWILGYILYVVTYSCGYKTDYYVGIGPIVPMNFRSYYIWYFQGSNCITSLDWIGNVRGYSPQLLVALISVGFVWNIILLATSIYILMGLYFNSGTIELRQKIFSSSLLLVSLWDLILVVVVSIDFSPLMDVNHYQIYINYTGSFQDEVVPFTTPTQPTKPTQPTQPPDELYPSILALPYFSEVFTVVVMLFSRLILFWIINVLFASYILAKNANESSKVNTNVAPFKNGPLQLHPDKQAYNGDINLMNRMPSEVLVTSAEDQMSFAQGRFERPINQDMALRDEVNRRWNINTGDQQPLREENMFVPVLNRSDFPSLPRPRVIENTRQSFSRTPNPQTPAPKSPEDHSNQLNNKFVYMVGAKQVPFVKLRPVRRDSNEENVSVTVTETSSNDNEATPYMVSQLSNLDPTYEPRDLVRSPPIPFVSSSRGVNKTVMSDLPPPPPGVPVSKMNVRPQISLQEALRTRGPLRPVSKIRPSIDTNC